MGEYDIKKYSSQSSKIIQKSPQKINLKKSQKIEENSQNKNLQIFYSHKNYFSNKIKIFPQLAAKKKKIVAIVAIKQHTGD